MSVNDILSQMTSIEEVRGQLKEPDLLQEFDAMFDLAKRQTEEMQMAVRMLEHFEYCLSTESYKSMLIAASIYSGSDVAINLDSLSQEDLKERAKAVAERIKEFLNKIVEGIKSVIDAIKTAFAKFFGWNKAKKEKVSKQLKQVEDVKKTATKEQEDKVEERRKAAVRTSSRLKPQEPPKEKKDVLTKCQTFYARSGMFDEAAFEKAVAEVNSFCSIDITKVSNLASKYVDNSDDLGVLVEDLFKQYVKLDTKKEATSLTVTLSSGTVTVNLKNYSCTYKPNNEINFVSYLDEDECTVLAMGAAEAVGKVEMNVSNNVDKALNNVKRITDIGTKALSSNNTDKGNRAHKVASMCASFIRSYSKCCGSVSRHLAYGAYASAEASMDIHLQEFELAMTSDKNLKL